MARLILALIVAIVPALAQQQSREFQVAGVCGRCHVTSVLEWSLSKHKNTYANCTGCHGPSQGHVTDERNNIKPERIPRGQAIASLCSTCHPAGCPKSGEKVNCQNCHQAHALVNPSRDRAVQDEQLKQASAKWESYERDIAEGERLANEGRWPAARDAFRRALEQMPGDRRAAARMRVCERRINPGLAGCEMVGSEHDSASGLPWQVRVKGTDIEMVLVPGGEFEMGSERYKDSMPVHTIRIEPFYLAKTELTRAQWKGLMGTDPSGGEGAPDADRLPVDQVSWDDSNAFIAKLNARVAGAGFRLPTEAEWEYAARAGSSGPPAGADLVRVAWFSETTAPAALKTWSRVVDSRPLGYDPYGPRAVATRQPNRWELYDMLGNVWEWCSSASRPYPYDPNDGRESAAAPGMRILRGGGFADSADYLDQALRHSDRHDRRTRGNGMRLARSVPEGQ